MECGVTSRFTVIIRSVEVDSPVPVLIYLAVYCKVRKANFTCFPNNSPGKARAVFKLYLELKSKLRRKKTDHSSMVELIGIFKLYRFMLTESIHFHILPRLN